MKEEQESREKKTCDHKTHWTLALRSGWHLHSGPGATLWLKDCASRLLPASPSSVFEPLSTARFSLPGRTKVHCREPLSKLTKRIDTVNNGFWLIKMYCARHGLYEVHDVCKTFHRSRERALLRLTHTDLPLMRLFQKLLGWTTMVVCVYL